MALERRDPLPPGSYSLDVTNEHSEQFTEWCEANAIEIVQSEDLESGGLFSVGKWYLFHVPSAAPWGKSMASTLGWPTIATDTANAPPPPVSVTDAVKEEPWLEDLEPAFEAASGTVVVVLVLLGLYLFAGRR